MRDFEYDAKAIEMERKEQDTLERDLKKQFVSKNCSFVSVIMLPVY